MILVFTTRRGVLVFLRFFLHEVLFVQKAKMSKVPCELIFLELEKLFDHKLH